MSPGKPGGRRPARLRGGSARAFAAVAAACLAGVLPGCATFPGGRVDPLAGRWAIDSRDEPGVSLVRVSPGRYLVESPGEWEGSGVLEGTTYLGVFRYPESTRVRCLAGAVGFHRGELRADGSLEVRGTFRDPGRADFRVVWSPREDSPRRSVRGPKRAPSDPDFSAR